jgi:hypothetical protein
MAQTFRVRSRAAPRALDQRLEALGLGARDGPPERGQAVRAAARIRGRDLLDHPCVQQTLDDPVERTGAEPDGSGRALFDFLHDEVAVALPPGEREEHVEHRGRERKAVGRIGHGIPRVMSGGVMSPYAI